MVSKVGVDTARKAPLSTAYSLCNVKNHLFDPTLAPISELFIRPNLWKENSFLETRRKVFLPVRAACCSNVFWIFLQIANSRFVMGKWPVNIYIRVYHFNAMIKSGFFWSSSGSDCTRLHTLVPMQDCASSIRSFEYFFSN